MTKPWTPIVPTPCGACGEVFQRKMHASTHQGSVYCETCRSYPRLSPVSRDVVVLMRLARRRA